jgi:hypothetical protein
MDGWITTHAPALRRFASAGCKVGAGEDSMKEKAPGGRAELPGSADEETQRLACL